MKKSIITPIVIACSFAFGNLPGSTVSDSVCVGGETLEIRQRARRLAQRGVALGGNVGNAGAFQKVENRCAGKGMGEATGR